MKTLRLRGLIAALTMCASLPAWAEGPEFPVKADGTPPCQMIVDGLVSTQFYVSTVKGVRGVLAGRVFEPTPTRQYQATLPCPSTPGQYYFIAAGAGVTGEGSPSAEVPFVITSGGSVLVATSGRSTQDLAGPGSGMPAAPNGVNDLEIKLTGLSGSILNIVIEGQIIGTGALETWSTQANGGSWTAVFVQGSTADTGSVFFEPADGITPGWKTTGPFTVHVRYQDRIDTAQAAALPTQTTGFAIGSAVKVTANLLTVRATPSPTGIVLAYVSKNATGTIMEGPTVVGATTYWKVKFTPTLTGWVSQAFLTPVTP